MTEDFRVQGKSVVNKPPIFAEFCSFEIETRA